MTVKHAAYALTLIAVTLLLAPSPASAEESESPPPLAEMWVLHAKPDHGDEFRAAIREHMAFRGEHGDPRAWQAYTPALGDELNRVAIRYCCVAWADVDAYREWSMSAEAVSAHFDEHVAPHVARGEHYFESIDWSNSHWSESGGPYRLFAVTNYEIKPGHRAELNGTLLKMSRTALEQGWASDRHSWLWMSRIGGAPRISIVIPHRDYAGMERGEDTFFRFLSEKLGSEEMAVQLFRQFDGATARSEFQIWVHHKELSMEDND